MTRARRSHHEAPDTTAAFVRLRRLEPGGPEWVRLRREIIEAWLPMAERISRRFGGRGEAAADLRQVAAMALVRAVDGYDPGLGHPFESYAVPTITGGLRRHFRDCVWGVRVPRRLQRACGAIGRARAELEQQLWTDPSVAQLAAATDLSESEVYLGLRAEGIQRTCVLDTLTGGAEGVPLDDTLGASDAGLDRLLEREALRPLLAELPERERRVLYLSFFEERTQKEIGARLGVSQMQVSRILRHTLARLREGLRAPA
ncbi:sigma-70 family RNA polymerase sigma factor [Streptomyces sp. SAJ15]|uniref:sigma-70 family RNA polymerase sigma factor n=1 Tax=Streptomyces sp. SAJ15 TaxID=2011095 RepID=UPI001186FA24|nr:sigma-70 family RNA polymerase sigma factor [Streptomyces sp. SAJ15]TVL93354.1 B/F/G family RNA polymerase sigma-70 factor [Streptomyces sp. SAJ15]